MTGRITVDSTEGVALITIERPDRLNALDHRMVLQLSAAIAEIDRDPSLRAVILTGAGDRAFCAGADVAAMRDMDRGAAVPFVGDGHAMTLHLERCVVPVIAAINGVALGGGTEIALSCDIRIASDRAVMGLPEVTLGIFPGWGGTQRAVRVLGPALAHDLVLTGRRVSAAEALRIGLVSQLVPAAELLGAARTIAGVIAGNSPSAVRRAKRAMREGAGLTVEQGLELEAGEWLAQFEHPDRVEGLGALLEKRPPRWSPLG